MNYYELKTKFRNPAYHLEKSLTARFKNTNCLLQRNESSNNTNSQVQENAYENKMRQI